MRSRRRDRAPLIVGGKVAGTSGAVLSSFGVEFTVSAIASGWRIDFPPGTFKSTPVLSAIDGAGGFPAYVDDANSGPDRLTFYFYAIGTNTYNTTANWWFTASGVPA
jgi:hypothetical protein